MSDEHGPVDGVNMGRTYVAAVSFAALLKLRRTPRTKVPRLAPRAGSMVRVTSGRFRPEIDGLRFVAIIPVMFSHLFQWVLRRQAHLGFFDATAASGYHRFVNHLPGVLLFFAISGYILTYQITNSSNGGYDWSKYGKYILRRFKRIAPPYYLVLIATFIVVGIAGFRPSSVRHFDASHVTLFPSLIASLFYSHWVIYREWPRLFGAGWTLEVETQYYIIAPLLTLIYLNIKKRTTKITIGIGMIFLSAIVASQLDDGNFWSHTILRFFPYFFTGMMALELQSDLKQFVQFAPLVVTESISILAVLLYLFVQSPEDGVGMGMLGYYFVNILCVTAMFIAVSIDNSVLRRLCVNRYVVIVGGACYSIYLTHSQVIFLLQDFMYKHVVFKDTSVAMILNALAEAPVAILVGLIFYRFIERPFMIWGRKYSGGLYREGNRLTVAASSDKG